MHRKLSFFVASIFTVVSCQAPFAAAGEDLGSELVAIYKDPAGAKAGFSKIILSDDPKTIAAVGVMLFDGVAVPIDRPNAIPFLEKAAELGRPEAQYRLGIAYSEGNSIYKDPPSDEALANKWFEKASKSAMAAGPDDAAAMTTLARLKQDGKGGVAPDADGAIRLIKAAAAMGYPDAEVLYGSYWSADLRKPDAAKQAQAEAWFGKAMAVGASAAFEGIGFIYMEGPEPLRALPYLRRAAMMGQERASRFLYLRFREKIGDNLALQQDQIFEKTEGAWLHQRIPDVSSTTASELSDPVTLAVTIVAISAIVGLAVTDPNAPVDPNYEDENFKSMQNYLYEQSALNDCFDFVTQQHYWKNGPC
jgi:TPR repeat protein